MESTVNYLATKVRMSRKCVCEAQRKEHVRGKGKGKKDEEIQSNELPWILIFLRQRNPSLSAVVVVLPFQQIIANRCSPFPAESTANGDFHKSFSRPCSLAPFHLTGFYAAPERSGWLLKAAKRRKGSCLEIQGSTYLQRRSTTLFLYHNSSHSRAYSKDRKLILFQK